MATNNAIATRSDNPLIQFREQLEQRAGEIKMALPSGITAEKFQRTVITAVQQNPDLLSASRQSLILACMKAAQDGLVPDGREAALVTFNQRQKGPDGWQTIKQVQYMPMVYGLRKKILQAKDATGKPIVSTLTVGVVYKAEVDNGYFRWEIGTDPEVSHRPMLDLTEEEAADENIVAAYSIARMVDGTPSCEVLRRFEINHIRQMSQTGAVGRTVQFGSDKGKEIPPKGPWVDWFPEMAKKTVMRRHSKTLPMSGDVILDLGTEQDEVDANISTAALLGGTPGGEPEMLGDQSDLPPHDKETGEVLDQSESDVTADNASAERVTESAESEHEDQRDELGVTADPNGEIADKLIASFRAAETIIDLKALYARSELDRAAMSDEVHCVVQQTYETEVGRLDKKASAANEARKARAAKGEAETVE